MSALRKVTGVVLGLALAAVLFAVPIQEGYHNLKDWFVWGELKKQLTESK